MRTSGIVMVSLFVLAGCGNGGPGQLDVGTDVTGADPGTEVIDAALDGIPSTGSRARVIVDEGDLIGGRQASGVTGDILLVNDHVRFVVRTRDVVCTVPTAGTSSTRTSSVRKASPGGIVFWRCSP